MIKKCQALSYVMDHHRDCLKSWIKSVMMKCFEFSVFVVGGAKLFGVSGLLLVISIYHMVK